MAAPQVGIVWPDSCQGVPAIMLSTAERVAKPTPRSNRSSIVQAVPQAMSLSANRSGENPKDSMSDSARISVSSVSSVNCPARRPV